MKDLILSFLTVPGILVFIYFIGLVSSSYRTKLKYFSTGLFMMFIFSLPIFGKIISYPLTNLPKYFINNDIDRAQSVVLLTGGIFKNSLGEWQPSRNTENRAYLAKNILKGSNIPIIISGGFTYEEAPSEAELTKRYYNLINAQLDTDSLNTYQSAFNLKKYCKDFNNHLLIITDNYHSLRSFLSFKSQGCNTIIYNYDNNIGFKDFFPSTRGFSIFNNAIYEYTGILYYLTTLKINIIKLF